MADYVSLSRKFFKDYKVYRYRMKKINDMTDDEVVNYCHWYCEENGLISEWNDYIKQAGLE